MDGELLRELRSRIESEQKLAKMHEQQAEVLRAALALLESGSSKAPAARRVQTKSLSDEFGPPASGVSTKELAAELLSEAGRALRARDLVDPMLDRGWGQNVAHPENAISTALSRLSQDDDSSVVRVGRGVYKYRKFDQDPDNKYERRQDEPA